MIVDGIILCSADHDFEGKKPSDEDRQNFVNQCIANNNPSATGRFDRWFPLTRYEESGQVWAEARCILEE